MIFVAITPLAGALILALVAVGVWLVRKGLWPKRKGDTPHCANCDYNLTGLVSERCPECGSDVTQPKAVVIGVRRRRPLLVLGGIACLLLPLAVLLTPLRSIDWYQFKPTTFVLGDLQSTSPRLPDKAWKEIDRRLRANKLSDGQKSRLIDICLKEQGGEGNGPVSSKLIDYLGQGWFAGDLSGQQEKKYLDQVARFLFEIRPRTSPADPILCQLKVNCRAGGAPIRYVIRTEAFLIDGQSWDHRFDIATELGAGASGGSRLSEQLKNVAPGQHVVTLRTRIKIYPGDPSRSGSIHYGNNDLREEQWSPSIHEKTVELIESFEVLAAEPDDYIVRIHDPDVEQDMSRNMDLGEARFAWGKFWDRRIREMREGWDNKSTRWSSNDPGPRPLPSNVAADVYLRIDGKEYFAGKAEGRKGDRYIRVTIDGIEGRTEPFDTFDLILKPNEQIARKTIDMYEIWDGIIVKEGVKARCELRGEDRDK